MNDAGNRLITRHYRPPNRLVSIFGSDVNGNCSLINGNICGGTSAVNDDIIPGVNRSNPASPWATELFTLRRPGVAGRIILSFEIDSDNHDRMELAVFNCPEMGISLPLVDIHFNDSFRLDRSDRDLTRLNASISNLSLSNISCDHLLVFCLKYPPTVSPTRYIDLEFPAQENINSTYVFLGEVTFLNGGSEPCDPAMPITITGKLI